MYYSSLKTEEGQPITFHIAYLDPSNPDPDPPVNIRNDRWSFVRLHKRIPISVPALSKIANASDPRTSSLAIYHDAQGKLFLWGLVDQGNSYYDYVNHESEGGFARPGLLQASILGAGHLAAFVEMEKIAELRINRLLTKVQDALWGGPLHEALKPGIETYFKSLENSLPKEVSKSPFLHSSAASFWIASLCRLFLRIQRYGHGGAILISPESSSKGLNINYKLNYKRLRTALVKHAALQMQRVYFSNKIFAEYLDLDVDEIPSGLYLDELINLGHLRDNRLELDGTIWFISLLTRVDGLVLLNPDLVVKGFGIEITHSKEPHNVYLAGTGAAAKTRLRKINYNHFGTRHRSMMRYCAEVPHSIGFVISQDGDLRAMTQVRGQLVVWENIKLQVPDFVRRR